MEELLRQLCGPQSVFRHHQREAIEDLLEGRRVLVVQRTGWGKSAVYLIATKLIRSKGGGPTILISPLLALMRNQIEAARRIGVVAETINSANPDEWERVEADVHAGELDLLLISPERLNNRQFQERILPAISRDAGLIVVDEVHCISDWGHDFRPDYRRIKRILALLPEGIPVLGTTATANTRVVEDVVDQLGSDLAVYRGPLDRESLALAVLRLPDAADRLAWLARAIPTFEGSGVVYVLTVRDTEKVSEWLRSQGVDAVAYSGDTEPEARLRIEAALLANEVNVVVATSALGMGFDKPDLSFVIHFQSPGSAIAYYQQVGRAGRAIPSALGLLMVGHEDEDIVDYFIESAFPPRHQAEAVIGLLQTQARPTRRNEILERINIRPSRLDGMLKILEVDGAVEWTPQGWLRTLQTWAYDEERVANVTAARRQEQQAMREYVRTTQCLMEFLRIQLDDPAASPCGRCANCAGDTQSIAVDEDLVKKARAFLRRSWIEIGPRKRWPMQVDGSTVIPPERTAEVGRSLCRYNDSGFGQLVARGKFTDNEFADDLVDGMVEMIEDWRPEPKPEWLTCVPSLRRPELVESIARRLAGRLGIPFIRALSKTRDTEEQKRMENSIQQFRNVWGAFAPDDVCAGPVFLVDDISDSSWTMTVAAFELLNSGSGPVFPLTLASARAT